MDTKGLTAYFRNLSPKKAIGLAAAIILAVIIIVFYYLAYITAPNPDRPIYWGATFSQKFASDMGLDWKESYRAILYDLKVKRLRLIAYWDLIEKENNKFSFEDLDYQFELASKNGSSVILAIGQKVPRWPECHIPEWAEALSIQERHNELISYLEKIVKRYKDHPTLLYWQAENEPFFPFGECPGSYPRLADEEISLIKSLDRTHRVMLTDSGEFGLWYFAANKGDVFGTTLYRRVYNKLFGYIDYHLPPSFFRIKELLTRFLAKSTPKQFLVIELSGEPWLEKQIYETTAEEHLRYFDFDFFKDTIKYANKAGFDTYYLWGAEWWYWLKGKQNHPEFWEYAKTIYTESN